MSSSETFREHLPNTVQAARTVFTRRLMVYSNHRRAVRGDKPRGSFRYAFEDRPPWWPAATDYSATAIKSLTRKDIEFLHSSLIGAMKEECPEEIQSLIDEVGFRNLFQVPKVRMKTLTEH